MNDFGLNVSVSNHSENISKNGINSTNHDMSVLAITILPFKILIIILTVFLNLIIILSSTIIKKEKTFSTYIFLSITISDLLVGCFSMSFMTIFTYFAYWPLGYVLCAFWVIVDYSTSTVNLISIFILTFQRYLLIKYPLTVTDKINYIKIFLIFTPWLLGFFYWIISVLLITYNESFDYINCYFTYTFLFVVTSDIIAFFLPIILISIFSVLTIYELYLKKNKKNKSKITILPSKVSSKITESKQKFILEKEEKAILCIIILTLNIILLWIIFLISWPLYAFCSNCVDALVMEIGYWLAYFASTTNPIIIIIFNQSLRKNIIKLILFHKNYFIKNH
jgi:hypothetical protein